MNQVRDTFSNWEPQAPAGVQEAVYAQLGKGSFWRFGLTTLNAWTLSILGGAAALALGFGLRNDDIQIANSLQETPSAQVEWSSTYPSAESDMDELEVLSGYPWQFAENVEPPALVGESMAAAGSVSPNIQEAPEALGSLQTSMLHATVQLPGRLTTRSQYLNEDIWSQLRDDERNEIKLTYDVKLSE